MNDLRVAVLTQWYPPEPVWQPQWIVDALRDSGADCRVVTGVPNYPTGRVQPGYRSWWRRRDVVDGVPVLRTPLYPDHGRGIVKRFANYVSWALSSALLGRRALREADVVLVYSSPATAAAAAVLTRRLHGTPYVLLVQDLWPDSVTQSGMLAGRLQRVVDRVLTPFVDATYRHAEIVVAISEGMRDLLVERGVDEERAAVVHNWVADTPPAASPAPSLRATLGIPDDDFVLMYAGNHGVAQGLGPVLDAFAGAGGDRHLVLIGDGVDKPRLQARAEAEQLPHVHFVDPSPSAAVRQWMHEADAQLVSLVDQPLFAVTVPSKLQMALAEGCPVLAVGTGDMTGIVDRADAGVSAFPGDVASIRAAVDRMSAAPRERRDLWGVNARTHYENTMAPDVGAARLMEILRAAAGHGHAVAIAGEKELDTDE